MDVASKKSSSDKTTKQKTRKNPSLIGIQLTILRKVPEKKEFVLKDGRKLRDIRELAFALGDMADDVFWHHVNDARNDFVNWVKDVFKDEELSEELKKVRDKFNTQLTVLKHIVKKI